MPGCFGLAEDHHDNRRPLDQLVEGRPQIDAFALRRLGLMVEGVSATLELGTGGTWRLARMPGKIRIGDQEVAVRSHPQLPVEVFVCPNCFRNCYRLHRRTKGEWLCRSCPPRLKYRSQCRDRSVPGLSRVVYLRREPGF